MFGTLSCFRKARGLTRTDCGATAGPNHSSPYHTDCCDYVRDAVVFSEASRPDTHGLRCHGGAESQQSVSIGVVLVAPVAILVFEVVF
jgi:hypothetical protein